MNVRSIIFINEEKCDGCGLCINACEEGAIRLVNGKAKLIDESYCDGLGACLESCPQGAIEIVEREAKAFNGDSVRILMKSKEKFETKVFECPDANSHKPNNWPIQLRLVAVNAAFLRNADLLIAADCTAFSCSGFHSIRGEKKLIIACPKLDDYKFYLDKLTEIFRTNSINSVSVIRMTVPCCNGLTWIVKEALKRAKKDLFAEEIIIDTNGNIKK